MENHSACFNIVDLSSGFEGGLSDVAIEVLHLILSHLLQHTEEEIGIPQETLEAFMNILRRGKSGIHGTCTLLSFAEVKPDTFSCHVN